MSVIIPRFRLNTDWRGAWIYNNFFPFLLSLNCLDTVLRISLSQFRDCLNVHYFSPLGFIDYTLRIENAASKYVEFLQEQEEAGSALQLHCDCCRFRISN
jgi:hypothetical protein